MNAITTDHEREQEHARAERVLRELVLAFDTNVAAWAADDDQGMNELLELVEDFRVAVRAEIDLTDRIRRGEV